MGRIVSIHEYNLKPGINGEQFEQAIHDAEARGLLKLPGPCGTFLCQGRPGRPLRRLRGSVDLRESRGLGTPVLRQ
jgi:hypothetical protein